MEEAPSELRLAAPAKLNLSLRVVGQRADGFHELETVMVLLELADELVLAPGDGLRVDPPSEDLPFESASNLAWRGLALGLGGAGDGVSLLLTKRIPVAAGLGGGSSDASAGWRLGRRRSGAAELPSAPELNELAGIGADVPFFAAQVAAARVSGIGERVEAVNQPAGTAREVVLAVAPFPLSTAEVFAELRQADWGSGGPAGNDLLAPARRLRPELDELMRVMTDAGVEPRLTGSGPTLFAILDDRERAVAVAERVGRAGVSAVRTRLRPEPASIEAVAAR
jgi:4-diphosphocytidyl-2-C-methyl-D-erythritol kinase